MAIEMKRYFFPVGQGNFCAEVFKNDNKSFTMVYDCGTLTKISNEKMKIFFEELPKKIDLFFISHFHMDHINKVKQLIEEKEVIKIIIPELSAEEKLFLYLCDSPSENYSETIKEIEFILKLEKYLEEEEKETKIEIVKIKKKEIEVFEDKNEIFPKRWLFKVFNIMPNKLETKIEKFKQKLKENEIDIEKKNCISKEDFEKIILIYKEIVTSQECNEHSLIVYSGFENDRFRDYIVREKHITFKKKISCLYTGDSELKKVLKEDGKFLKKAYYKNVGTLQVPHHGSSKNSSKKFFNKNIKAIICAGSKNRYNHPDKETILEISSQESQPIILTESNNIYSEEITFCNFSYKKNEKNFIIKVLYYMMCNAFS